MSVQFKDYYETLGVARGATEEEIQRAFRRLAKKYHPDVSKEPDAGERFREVNEAYQVIGDAENREKYDNLGANWKNGEGFTPPPGWENFEFHTAGTGGAGPGAADFSDFFQSIFGGGFEGFGARHGARGARRGHDREAEIEIGLEEAVRGVSTTITLAADPVGFEGRGRTPPRTLDVKIPAGVVEGTRIRLSGQGDPGTGGAPAGDLYLRVRLRSHPGFRVEGRNLRTTVRVSPWEAALGARVDVPTLEGVVTLSVPAGTQGGQTLRLRGKGIPRGDGPGGDLLVTVRIALPERLSEKEKELFEELRRHSEFEPRS